MDDLTDLERGLVTGLVIGEGHFGAYRGRAQIVGKMHVRHEPLLRWVAQLFPRGAPYGPYRSDGREVEPVLQTGIDPRVLRRLSLMKAGTRAYMAGVRARDANTARAPREKLTVVG
jgi:hypothetical protein